MKTLMLVLLAALTGCTTLNPVMPELTAQECYDLGVKVDFNDGPMLPVVEEHATTFGGVAKHCDVASNQYGIVAGCIKPVPGGFAVIYSDRRTRLHEHCHALYGPDHARAPWMGREWAAKKRCDDAYFDGDVWRCREVSDAE